MIAGVLVFLARYKLLFEIGLIGALAVGAVYEVHQFLEHERDIGRAEVQGRWDKKTAEDKEAARIDTARLAKQSADAEKNGLARDETIRALTATTNTAALGLRDALAAVRSRVPDASPDALRATASAFGDVLAGCTSRRREMAVEAERLNSEKQTLIDAWPKPKE